MAESHQNIYDYISGESQNSALTSASVLESLKTISYFEERKKDVKKGEEPFWLKLYDQEIQYIAKASQALTEDPVLASKMGKDFGSALKLAGLLKQMNAEKQAKAMLDSYLPRDSSIPSQLQNNLVNKDGAV